MGVIKTDEQILVHVWAQRTVANCLTLLRVVLPLPIYAAIFYGSYVWAEALIVLAMVTDAEGSLARATNTTTPLGWAFDPIADKVFMNLLMPGALFLTGNAWVLLLWVVMLGYDLDNTIRRWSAIREACVGKMPTITTPVTLVSKAKTVLLFSVLVVAFAPPGFFPTLMMTLLLQFSFIMVIYSWVNNRRRTLRKLYEKIVY